MTKSLDIEYLRKVLTYDSDTGLMKWNHRPLEMFPCKRSYATFNKRFAGKEAGYTHQSVKKSLLAKGHRPYYYRLVGIKDKTYKLHRLAWAIHYGYWPDFDIDHIDGNPLNNKICNLRKSNKVENGKNLPKRSDNTSGVVGVCFHKRSGTWKVSIGNDYVGMYKDFDDAIEARRKAEIEYGYSELHGREDDDEL